MNTWQPIATAPRDGTVIWVRFGGQGEAYARWHNGNWCFGSSSKMQFEDGHLADFWQPLSGQRPRK